MGQNARSQKTTAGHSPASLLVDAVERLPALPAVVTQLLALLDKPSIDARAVAKLIMNDQSIAAKLLRVVNSSYYSVPGGVSDIQRAVTYLGFNTLAQMVMGVSVIAYFKKKEVTGFSLAEFWRHSVAVASAAKLIAGRLGGISPEDAFTWGLLHDLGKLVLLEVDRDCFERVWLNSRANRVDFLLSEKALGLPGHTELGATLAKKWGLPLVVADVMSGHHGDTARVGTPEGLISLANRFVHFWESSSQNSGNQSELVGAEVILELQKWGLSADSVASLATQLHGEMERAGVLISVY